MVRNSRKTTVGMQAEPEGGGGGGGRRKVGGAGDVTSTANSR